MIVECEKFKDFGQDVLPESKEIRLYSELNTSELFIMKYSSMLL